MTNENEGPVDTGLQQNDVAALNPEPAAPAVPAADPVPAQQDDEQEEGQDQDPDASAASDGTDAPARPRNKGVGKRIDELTRDKHDALRERDHWRDLALKAQAPQDPAPVQAATPQEGKPTLEQFDFDTEAFQEALTDWKVDQRLKERDDKVAADRAKETAQQRARTLSEREAVFLEAHPDYRDVAYAPHVPITQAMSEMILETEDPPALAYYLGKNLEEAAAIAQMPPLAAARAIGRIEASLSAPAPAANVPRPPTPASKAPAPVPTLRPAAPIRKDLADMDQADYIAERNRQRKAAGLTR